MATLHATHPRDTLSRLETMAMMSDIGMPLVALRTQLASAINLIVQVSRLQDGSRKVTHVTEVLGFDSTGGSYVTQDIFARDYEGFDASGRILSNLRPTGILPQAVEQLREHGVDLPASVYETAERRSRDHG